MDLAPDIVEVRHQGGYRLWVLFADSREGEVDLRDRIIGKPGLFAALHDEAYFAQVSVDAETGVLMWPNGVDICGDVIYHLVTGTPLPTNKVASRVRSGI